MKKIVQPKIKVSILAKISLFCAIFVPIILCLFGIAFPSLILMVPLSLLLAIVLGIIACYKISKNREYLKGRNWAISGIIIGGLFLTVIIAISAPKFWKASQTSKIGTAIGDIDFIVVEPLQRYYEDIEHYPSTEAALKALETRNIIDDPDNKWNGPYIRFHKKNKAGNPIDPWGNEYQYTGDGKSFTILSYGADGKPGGTGFNADISKTVTAKGK